VSGSIDAPAAAAGTRPPPGGLLGALERLMGAMNRVMLFIGMLTLVIASIVLTYSVFSRYLFRAATDWQDEVAVFCIICAVFLCGAWVQAQRGHVGIEAVSSILPARVNRIRMILVDLMSLAFCAFFAWKSWTLFHEAWVDKMTTSSTFSPPLTIPYGLMAAGMTLLVVQLLLQSLLRLAEGFGRSRE
jgi:TRAP-type C4-dicarboxylate transport system permease small subunit